MVGGTVAPMGQLSGTEYGTPYLVHEALDSGPTQPIRGPPQSHHLASARLLRS